MSNSATSRGSDRIISYCLGYLQRTYVTYLPSANEVRGKVIYSEVSVSISTWGSLCMMSPPVWLPAPMFLLGDLCPGGLCAGGFMSRSVSVQGGLCPGMSLFRGLCLGGISVGRPPGIRKAGSTHPTGMLSCLQLKYLAIARI